MKEPKFKTTDKTSYHNKFGSQKAKSIYNYIKSLSDIKNIYDVGCNAGKISYPLQKDLGLNVLGVDFSQDLQHPKDYNFIHRDIVNDNPIYMNDVTLFLSLYHHVAGAFDLASADNVFFKLFLRSKYLIFDVGNLSEKQRSNTYWYKHQKQYFSSEDDLLNHFNIPYTVIDKWAVAGGHRKVVVFKNENVNPTFFKVVNKYWSRGGSPRLHLDNNLLEDKLSHPKQKGTIFYKLEHNNKFYFAKKRLCEYYVPEAIENFDKEISNIQEVYNNNLVPPNQLVDFFGYNEHYGLIYEWVDNLKYVKKQTVKMSDGRILKDCALCTHNGTRKIVDFER